MILLLIFQQRRQKRPEFWASTALVFVPSEGLSFVHNGLFSVAIGVWSRSRSAGEFAETPYSCSTPYLLVYDNNWANTFQNV